MKRLFPFLLVFLFILYSGRSFGVIHIVDNNPGSTATYTTIGAAFTAAAAGDTIYVMGSTNTYGCFTWDKKMTLIGPGHNPVKQNSLEARIGGCGPVINFLAGTSGSSLIGFYLLNSSIWAQQNVHNITISGNYIFDFIEIKGSGFIIENNVFISSSWNLYFTGTNIGSTLIRHNVFSGTINNALAGTTEITNNVFLKNGNAFAGVSNVSIKNNIFHNANPAGTSNANFENNITFQTSDTLPTAGNLGSGNINANPLFVNIAPTSYVFSYNHNYDLQSGSPGKNAGTDGKDIGLYGGTGSYHPGGEPSIPIIRKFSIKNTVVPPNGNLEIKIEAETQD